MDPENFIEEEDIEVDIYPELSPSQNTSIFKEELDIIDDMDL